MRTRGWRRLALVAAVTMMQPAAWPAPEEGPQAPCGAEAIPGYPDVDAPPAVRVWSGRELGANWAPPNCTGWAAPGFSTLVVTAARFRSTGGMDGLLQRIAQISALTGIRYWSTTHQAWRALILSAYALTGPAGDHRRNDFSGSDLAEGKTFYYAQEDSLSGKGTYAMRIRSATPERLVFTTENISTLRYLLLPVFHPGDIQSAYFLEREAGDVWRYYNLVRTGKKANSLVSGHSASSVNRAVAFYRHLAGIRTDQEPPAAR
jgi:hypothetical protein